MTYLLGRSFRSSARLNGQHLLWTRMQGYLVHPKVQLPAEPAIADVCTGTGAWILDVSRQLSPAARLDGFDIDLRQSPHANWLPANVSMLRLDVHEPVPAERLRQYDLVHVRFLNWVVRDSDPAPVIRNLIKMVKPGGFFQWTEMDAYSVKVVTAAEDIQAPKTEEIVRHAAPILQEAMGDRPGWVACLGDIFESCGLGEVRSERYEVTTDDRANWHDNTLLAFEEISDSGPEARKLRDMLEASSQEVEESGRGVAMTCQGVTVVGRVGH